MTRCPDGYCCQGNDTCQGIDSCNTGRTGTLCGTCEQNLTEALFTPKCVPTENCKSGLLIILFISAALIYAVILLSLSTIKDQLKVQWKIIYGNLKKCCANCKMLIKRDKEKVKSTNKQISVEDVESDEGGLKYMTILFYYVQDAKLFTVYLPQVDVKTENVVVKFLEFSPEILAIYIEVTELCFAFSNAIIKVAFELSFRFLVMLFLYLTYLIHRLLSRHTKCQVFLESLKVKLVEAFVLTVLFSYQKLLKGTFTLIQCVDVRNVKVLFIQTDVECYTWWQIGILVYICISVAPLFVVLAHLPFGVKDKKMSVRTFILGCFFPLPVIVWYQVVRIWNRRRDTKKD